MSFFKRLSNLVFGTHFMIGNEYDEPSKKKLIANMYRHYGAKL